MEPISWILLVLLSVSSGTNYWQNKKVDKQAGVIKNISNDLNKANAEIQARDKILLEKEADYRSKRKKYEDSIQNNGFVIYSQAKQLTSVNPDKFHKVHEKTTKDFSDTVGVPKVKPTEEDTWNSEYLSSQKVELINSRANEKAALEEVESLRDQLRESQRREISLIESLDEESTKLKSMTKEHSNLFSQFSEWIKIGSIIGVVLLVLYLWSLFRGLKFKSTVSKYKNAFETFSEVNDEGNELAAKILQDLKLSLPRKLMKKTIKGKYSEFVGDKA